MSLNFIPVELPPGDFRGRSQGRGQLIIQWGEQFGEDLFAITARGALHIQDGTSSTVLVSERTGSTASCSVDPADGEPVLESLMLLMREPGMRPAEFVIIKIVHTAESPPGTYHVEITIGEQMFSGTMSVRSMGLLSSGNVMR